MIFALVMKIIWQAFIYSNSMLVHIFFYVASSFQISFANNFDTQLIE